MLQNYLHIAWRNLRKNKTFSAINIFGLALGMAVCLLIIQYVSHELSYDQFHRQKAQVYRIQYDYRPQPDLLYSYATTYPGVGPRIKDQFPEVEDFLRLNRAEAVVSYQDRKGTESAMFFADASFFRFFSFPMVEGDPAKVLSEPNKAVLSESAARRYFGKESPVGKTIRLNGELPLQISGVFGDIPENSHLKADILISFATLAGIVKAQGQHIESNWGWFSFYHYLKLKPGVRPEALEKKLPQIVEKYRGKDMLSIDSFRLQPLADIHLTSKLIGEISVNGDADTVRYLLLIAVLILALAWINYVNLSTARAADRAKEVGVRKAVGSSRSQLIGQFMLESALVNAISLVVAITLVQVAVPLLRSFTGISLPNSPADVFTGPGLGMGAALLAMLLAGTVLSGAYPAFVLSAYRPVTVLKGQLKNSAKGLWLRRSLITLQFVASVVLLVGTFAVYRQLQFMRKGNLGVNIHQTLVVKAPQVEGNGSTLGKMQVFKTEVQGIGRIESVTSSTEVPGKEVGQARDNIYRVGESPSSATTYNIYGIDDQFIPTYGISLAAGRNFSRAYRTDSSAVVLNEEAARQLGFASPAASVGQKISHPERGPLEVVGVIRNFHQRGFREAYNPTLFLLQRGSTGFISLRIGANGLAAEAMDGTIGKIKKEYEQAFPGNPFDYFFLDDYYNQQYKADQQFGTVFSFFAALAIIIACLGLSGLISLTTLQRTKEIGVRKVLGASLSEILLLLSRDFLRLVLWANLIAWPIAWYLTGKWLENYVFRITVSPWLFVLPALLVGVVALLTVCVQTLKAARANPVDSLKYE